MASDDLHGQITALEAETQGKVSDSLSKIDVALADWEATKKKPQSLAKRIAYLQSSQSLLSGWMKESLKGKKDLASTVDRLRTFVEISRRLEATRSA